MDPLPIIGWIVLILLLIPIVAMAANLAISLVGLMRDYISYLRTRSVSPSEGQIWDQDGSSLHIINVYDSGRIGIRMGNGSWSDSPEQWKNRVRKRHVRLIKDA